MSTWRMAGLNYVTYSNIAARTLRKSLKSEFRADAEKRNESLIKVYFWSKGTILPLGKKPDATKDDSPTPT